MEIKEVAYSPYLYATVASLAALIIGALAYQKIGLLNNCAPVTGIVMMSVGAGVIFFEGIIFGWQRRPLGEIQFYPPQDSEKPWTMTLPGQTTRLPFVLLGENEIPKVDSNKFVVWSSPIKGQSKEYYLRISVDIGRSFDNFIIGCIKNNNLEVDDDNRIKCMKFLQLRRDHSLTVSTS